MLVLVVAGFTTGVAVLPAVPSFGAEPVPSDELPTGFEPQFPADTIGYDSAMSPDPTLFVEV